MKVDRTNPDLAYWEKLLAEDKLEVLEPENEEVISPIPEGNHGRRVRDGNRDMEKLYEKFDGRDGFFTGHQITRPRMRRTETPEWALNNAKIQSILLTAFPRLKTNPRQRTRAARWARAIYLHYHMGMSYGRVAEEMGEKPANIDRLLHSIRRVAEGKRSNTGKSRTGVCI